MSDTFDRLWAGLAPLGRDRTTGGYRRLSWTPVDAELRAWFTSEAQARGMTVEADGNGNLWAWWPEAGPDAVVTGSHLDSVPNGGGYDGPLGVVSALAAVDELKQRGLRPQRPLAVVVFVEEEGARFGVPRLGSRCSPGPSPRNGSVVSPTPTGSPGPGDDRGRFGSGADGRRPRAVGAHRRLRGTPH